MQMKCFSNWKWNNKQRKPTIERPEIRWWWWGLLSLISFRFFFSFWSLVSLPLFHFILLHSFVWREIKIECLRKRGGHGVCVCLCGNNNDTLVWPRPGLYCWINKWNMWVFRFIAWAFATFMTLCVWLLAINGSVNIFFMFAPIWRRSQQQQPPRFKGKWFVILITANLYCSRYFVLLLSVDRPCIISRFEHNNVICIWRTRVDSEIISFSLRSHRKTSKESLCPCGECGFCAGRMNRL